MAALEMVTSEMAAPRMAAPDLSILLTLNKLKKLIKKLPWEELDAYASCFGHGLMSPALHPGFSDL